MRLVTILLIWLNIACIIGTFAIGLYFQSFMNLAFAAVLYFQLKTMDHLQKKPTKEDANDDC